MAGSTSTAEIDWLWSRHIDIESKDQSENLNYAHSNKTRKYRRGFMKVEPLTNQKLHEIGWSGKRQLVVGDIASSLLKRKKQLQIRQRNGLL